MLASLPLVALQYVAMVVGVLLFALHKLFYRLAEGTRVHVWWTAVRGKRWVRGVPTWTPADLIRGGVQPQTKHEISVALRSELLMRACVCGDDKCRNRDQFMPAGIAITAKQLQDAIERGVIERRNDHRTDKEP